MTLAYLDNKDVKANEDILAFSLSEKSYDLSIVKLCEIVGFVCHDHIAFTTSEASYDTWLRLRMRRVRHALLKNLRLLIRRLDICIA